MTYQLKGYNEDGVEVLREEFANGLNAENRFEEAVRGAAAAGLFLVQLVNSAALRKDARIVRSFAR